MSHSNSTTHLGLPQFTDSDKPSWRGDINEAFRVIDQAIADNANDISIDNVNLPGYNFNDLPVLAIADAGTLIYDKTSKRVLLWNGSQYRNVDGSAL